MIICGSLLCHLKTLATNISYILMRWRFSLILGLVFSLFINIVRDSSSIESKVEQNVVLSEDQNSLLKVSGPEIFCCNSKEEDIRSIIYIESTGHECLTPRQACGIETAARANPMMKVILYVNNIRVGPYDPEPVILRHGRVRTCAFNKLISLAYGNVNIVKTNFLDKIRQTDFWQLVESRQLLKSQWYDGHISEIMRLILLNETGGIYLDFNNIVFRPLSFMPNTFSYLKGASNVANALMATNARHPFLKYLTKFLVKNYDPDNTINISSLTLARVFKLFCKQDENIPAGTFACSKNSSVTLMNPDAFFPIKENQHQYFYLINHEGIDESFLKSAFMTYVYLSNAGTQVHKNSLYAQLATQYCPNVWNMVSEIKIPLGF